MKRMSGQKMNHVAQNGLPPVHDVLISIIDHLSLPVDLLAEADAIRSELKPGLSPERLQWAVKAVASLMLGVHAKLEEDKRKAEVMIGEVSRHLLEMETNLEEAEKDAVAAFEANRNLIKRVHLEIGGIIDLAKKARSMAEFRPQLALSLEAIKIHFENKSSLDSNREQHRKSEFNALKDHVAALENQMAAQKLAIEKALEESHKDPLTGVLNRLAFNERIGAEVARATRYAQPLSLIIFDLDHFKSVNDSFGHLAGDESLKSFSKIASGRLRAADCFCRFGGEEFAAILPSTIGVDAFKAAEKVRRSLEKSKMRLGGGEYPLTVSCGIAELVEADDPPSLINKADKALYRAKESGRNRSELFAEPPAGPGVEAS